MNKINTLRSVCEVEVRYNEADPMGVVWHGHYIQYFENGRESFGKKYGLGYLQIEKLGYTLPVVSIHCLYKSPLKYGDTALIETTYIDSPAAKVEFEYVIKRKIDNKVVATGKSTQVFLDGKGTLQLLPPPFIGDWKIKNGLLQS